jgi:DNA-binding transcriptional LysR family regulator
MKGDTMKHATQPSHSNHPPGVRRRAPFAAITMAVLAACIALVPSVHHASACASGGVVVAEEDPGPPRDRKRWWLNTWCHSMQETCFLLWMDDTTGSTAWRWTMSVRQVNTLYVWWSLSIWQGTKGP